MDETRLEQMPHTIGRYQIQESIGYGAMGAVYKAFDPLIKRTLAIKTIRLDIPKQSPQYKSFIERFYHEARISGTLSHPNIVTLFDIGEEGGIPYLAMEFVEGETIASRIERGQRFNPERVISLVSQIASAVDYAHSKGVIHRDIKPSNLILYEGERVKVTDFGIAKLIDAEMTQSGTLLGTPSYMSPEQAMGDKLDGRSDIFSLGVCAFEMLCGEQPFPGNNVTSILYKLVHVDPILPANLEMNGLVPQKWHEVFGRVLAKKPDDRYQTATDFVQDLEYCLGAWFGSAMGDEPGADEASAPASDATAALPVLESPSFPSDPAAPAPVAAAVSLPPVPGALPPPMPPPVPAPVSSTAPTPRPLVAATPPRDEPLPATVNIKAGGGDHGGATAFLKRPDLSLAPAPTDSTVPVTAPPIPPRPTPSAEPATVLMNPGALPPRPTEARPPVATGADEKTVLMNPGSLSGSGSLGTAPQPSQESTVLMGAVGPRPTPAMDVTVKAAVPPGAKPAAPEARRVPSPPVVPPVPSRPAPSSRPGAAPVEPAPAWAPAPEPAAAKGPPLALILGGLGVLVFLAAIAGGLLLYRQLAKSAAPLPAPSVTPTTLAGVRSPVATPPPPPVAGTLRVNSQPPGASVNVDGQSRGVTPLDVTDLALGTHEVKVELRGFTPMLQRVDITEEALRAELSLTLVRPTALTGTVDFLSTPPGAAVMVDGASAGATPLVGRKLKPGAHRVQMTHDGYEPWEGTVNVVAGRPARVEAPLRAVPKPVATPVPDTVDPSRVYMNVPSDVDQVAKKVSGSSVSYPTGRAPKLRSGESVSVTVTYVISDTGEVTDLRVLESGGKVLDEEVLKAIRGWKYSPAVKKGVKVKVRATFKQTFRAG